MNSPITGNPMKLVLEPGNLTFRKEEFEITYHYYLCDKSGERFTTDVEDQKNQIQVYNQYREKYGIPFPDEIKEIRAMYGISASKISEILGFGANSYRLYESGEIPSVANGRLILAIKHPLDFIKQVEASANLLSKKDREILIQSASKIAETQKRSVWNTILRKHLFLYEQPNQFSGYKRPDLNKIAHIIAFFNEHMELYKTKLNKLLFYVDFGYYKRTAFSITGLTYRAIPLGPVPANYDKLFIKLCEDETISISQELIGNDNYGDLIKSNIPFDRSLFSGEELAVLSEVNKKFIGYYAKQMVDISHSELAWELNKEEKGLISYQKYAFGLKNM